jgi:hypothetical protein
VADNSVRHRPNVLFNLIGVLLIVGGIALTIVGIAYVFQIMGGFDPFKGDGPPVKTADGAALAFWGIIVFTIGRYFWRGARKRGLRDRFGRLLIISGYVLLGLALDAGVHSAVGLWSTQTEQSMQSVGVRTVLTVALWGIPAAILGAIGFKLANEKALATADVKADL